MELIKIPCFGVAGNFTGHLEQAGEDKDFVNLKTKEVNAPKGIFPTYIPGSPSKNKTPDFLSVFPFNPENIIFPKGESKLQIESECALIFNVVWKDDLIIDLIPISFGASNDCSIRKEGAKKISEKKNWGKASKGFSSNQIKITSFDEASVINDYRIASFLVRDNKVYEYGQDSAVKDYSYIYLKLKDWLIEKFNYQSDEGPLENIHEYLLEAGKPSSLMVSIGATRYTAWGETNFLQDKDKALVILYPESKYSKDNILEMVQKGDFSKDISALIQTVEI